MDEVTGLAVYGEDQRVARTVAAVLERQSVRATGLKDRLHALLSQLHFKEKTSGELLKAKVRALAKAGAFCLWDLRKNKCTKRSCLESALVWHQSTDGCLACAEQHSVGHCSKGSVKPPYRTRGDNKNKNKGS